MELNIFRKYRHKQFNYRPLYYNQQKEELQERIRIIEREEKGIHNDNYTPGIIKGSFQPLRSLRFKSARNSTYRVFIIAFILLVLVYFLFRI